MHKRKIFIHNSNWQSDLVVIVWVSLSKLTKYIYEILKEITSDEVVRLLDRISERL